MRSLRVLSFAVSLCIICGIIFGPISASALYELDIDPWGDLEEVKDPGITDTPMVPPSERPDQDSAGSEVEGEQVTDYGSGFNLFSLNDDSALRYVSWFLDALFESVTAEEEFSYSDTDSATTSDSRYKIDSHFTAGVRKRFSLYAGSYFDWEAAVVYKAGEYQKLRLNGSVYGGFDYWCSESGEHLSLYPYKIELLVNGEPYGDPVQQTELVDNGYTDDDTGDWIEVWQEEPVPIKDYVAISFDLPIDVDIGKVGFRFSYPYNSSFLDSSTTLYEEEWNYGFFVYDESIWVSEEAVGAPEYEGILGTIVGWLTEIKNAITGLTGKLVDGLLDGLSGLFVPSEEDITQLKDKYDTLLRDRLGFIYQGFDATVTNVETIVTGMESTEEYSFTVPEISFTLNGEKLVILEETPVSLDNEAMDVLRGLFGTAVCVICVGAWLSLAFDMVVALISGVSYFTFLARKREEDLFE